MEEGTLHADNPLRGALYVTGAAFMFASMGMFVKLAAGRLSSAEIVFFRSLFGLVSLAPWLLRGGVAALSTTRYRLHLFRALSGLGAMYCYFYAIAKLPLAEAVLLNFSAPLFIPFVALCWLREAVPRRIAWAIGIGFVGVVLVLRPGLTSFSTASWIGLASGVLAAVALVSVRRLSNNEPTTRIVFYFAAHATVISALPVVANWTTPTPVEWAYLWAAGISATMGQLLLTRGYAHAPAAQVGPYHYTAVLFAAAYGFGLWAERPDRWMCWGALLICLAGVMATRRAGLPAVSMYSALRGRRM